MISHTLSPLDDIEFMMKRVALYSRRIPSSPNHAEAALVQPVQTQVDKPASPSTVRKKILTERLLILIIGMLLVTTLFLAYKLSSPTTLAISQEQIDAAVLHTLSTKELPSRTAKAAAIVAPSVVRIRTDFLSSMGGTQISDQELGIGTGVVIKEDGTILTNLHVVANAPRLIVTFSDGLESPAVLVSVQKDKDLATIKPLFIPDDLEPATLGTNQSSSIGDEVVAIGFPFGYGPSVSAGVISGFNREYKPENSPVLKGLIQFDAAANPGNSGGPLVNMAGEVLGIVTAIMNPGHSKTFSGIGFAVTIESAGAALGIPPF
jgi:S1-C subfamily serine protease